MSLSSILLRKCSNEHDDKPEIFALDLDPNSVVSTVKDLRRALQKTGKMHKDDLFLLPTGFALARIDEPDKPWEILKMDEKTVAVLSMPRSSSTYPPTHPPTSETGETKSGNLKEQERSLATALGIDGPAKSSFTFFVTMRRQPFGFVAGFLNKPQLKPLLRASHKFIWNAANLGGTDWDAIYEKNACLRGVILGREPVCAPRKLIDEGCLGACLTHTTGDAVTRRTHTVSNELDSKYATFGWSQAALGVITQFIVSTVIPITLA